MCSLIDITLRSLIIFFILFISSCRVNDPEKLASGPLPSIQTEGTSSTEAWLRIKADGVNPTDIVSLQRDGSVIMTFCMTGKDTLIYEDSLTPGRQYSYKATVSTPKQSYKSDEVSIRTMDTTSHDFHFRSFVVCNRSSGLLDVAIINENDIWAVGQMYTNLPEGKEDYEPVGAAHWDGKEWKQVKLPAVVSQIYKPFLTPYDVLAFSPTDIWFAWGGVIHFDGKKVTKCYWIADFPGNIDSNIILEDGKGITKLWGTSSSNIYGVGNKGGIAHFDGKKWHKIESNTDLDIQAVWGSTDPVTGEEIVLCVASNIFTRDDPKILQIKNDQVTELSTEGLTHSLCSVWFRDLNKVYIAGDGDFLKNLNNKKERWRFFSKLFTPYWSNAVKGNDLNDIVLAGSFGDICHFNGRTWKTYLGKETDLFNGEFYGLDISGNTICAVGGTGGTSVVVLGQR